MDQEIATRAAHLRSLSGLTTIQLASIFGVSRQSYQMWLKGDMPRGATLLRFLAVVGLIDEAAERFPDPASLRIWLLTPVSPGGKIPLDFLQAQQYDTFRGFLLRQSIRQWPRPSLSERERARLMEQEFGHLTWREEV